VELVGVDEVVRLRRALTGITRKFNAAATEEGLTPSEASALGLIARYGPLPMSQLLEMEHVDAGGLAPVVVRLIERGFVSRQPLESPLPDSVVAVTGNGRKLHERIKTRRAAIVSDRVACLSPQQRSVLVQALPTLESLADNS
jgi:DNA-binding MarR family transcriptional regulator